MLIYILLYLKVRFATMIMTNKLFSECVLKVLFCLDYFDFVLIELFVTTRCTEKNENKINHKTFRFDDHHAAVESSVIDHSQRLNIISINSMDVSKIKHLKIACRFHNECN